MAAVDPQVSVVVPSYRRFAPLLDTIDDLLGQRNVDFEILVVDQNEEWPAEFESRRSALMEDMRVHWFEKVNPGVVAARNMAAREARGEIIVFVDDDVAIEQDDFLLQHQECYSDSSVAAVTGAELYADSDAIALFRSADFAEPALDSRWTRLSYLEQVLSFPRSGRQETVVCSFCTCNGSVRRSEFWSVGGFDNAFRGNAYGDDYDFAIRLASRGAKVIYSPRPWLIHLQAPLGGLRLSDQRNPASRQDQVFSPLLFFFRHVTRGWFWHLFYRHVLRKTVLRRDNVINPVSHLLTWLALIQVAPAARRASKRIPETPDA